MKKPQLLAAAVLLASVGNIAVAQELTKPDPEIERINAKYEAEYKKLKESGDKLEKDAPKGEENAVGVDVDFSKWHDVSFDVPEFRMTLRKIAFDIPQVTMKTRKISWDEPHTSMERRKVGQKPEIHGTTIRWTDIFMDVPVTTMKRRELKLDLPEIKMKRTEVSAGIPEITGMRRVSFKVPDIKVRSTDSATDKTESGSAEMQKTAKTLGEAHQTEIKGVAKKNLLATRADLEKEQKSVLAQLASAIEATKASGVDPAKLKAEDGTETNLIAILADTTKQFEDGLRKINEALEDIEKPIGPAQA